MNIDELFKDDYILAGKVKLIFGIPEVMLKDEDIISPIYRSQAISYLKKRLKEILDIIESSSKAMIENAYAYYIAYLIAPTMYVRLPQKMENISTKTTLQNIDWYKFAEDMLNNCDKILDDILDEYGIENTLGLTFIDISDATSYPNEIM